MEPKKSVGLWVRVSTDLQGDSAEHHEIRGRHYAEAKGWNIVRLYSLEAMSGKSVMGYPQTSQMLADIRSGEISGIIFTKLARLARNTKELLEFSEIFRENNADLISLEEAIDTSTPAGRLFYTMIGAMAQWEREEISSRIAASVPIRAKLGKTLGGTAPFGYKYMDKKLEIDATEAPVRKLVHELFLKYKRKKTVARELNNMGYRMRNGKEFSDMTINVLLTDSAAKGIRRVNYVRYGADGKRVIKPESEWVYVKCPAIVEEEIWNECNRILEEQREKNVKPGPRSVHLLAGFVHCDCGGKMYVYHRSRGNDRYTCKACRASITESDLDEIFHEQLKAFLLTDTDLAEYEQKSDKEIREKELLLSVLTEEASKNRKRMDELVNMRLNGEMTRDSFVPHYKPLEERMEQLNKQMPELQANIDFLKIQHLSSDTVLQGAKDLYNQWPLLAFDEKRAIVEIITEKITVGAEDIHISLSYLPAVFGNAGKSQSNLQGI